MAPDGRYEFIRPDDKAKVEADFDAMKALLQKAGSVETMSQQDKVHLFNLQENANGILTHSDSNRLVCEHTAPWARRFREPRAGRWANWNAATRPPSGNWTTRRCMVPYVGMREGAAAIEICRRVLNPASSTKSHVHAF